MPQSREELLRKKREYAAKVRNSLTNEEKQARTAYQRNYYDKNRVRLNRLSEARRKKRYWANLEESRKKKRERAARDYAKHRGRILAQNAKARQAAKLRDPEGFAMTRKVYAARYVQRHPDRRKNSVEAYYRENRSACTARCVAAIRKRKLSDPIFCIRVTIRNRLVGLLQSAKCTPTNQEAAQIFRWFEWLREQGCANWREKGVEVDHVIPVSKFNVSASGAAAAINSWRNLFPLPKQENRDKKDKILPGYIRKVWRLADQFTNEQPPRLA